jgi:gliding motility associated protien GldN
MKSNLKWLSSAAFCLMVTVAFAQVPEDVTVNNNDAFPDFTKMGSSTPSTTKPATKPSTSSTTPPPQTQSQPQQGGATAQPIPQDETSDMPADADAPLDGIVERKTILDKGVLPWENIRESDIMWSQTVWRVIDVREKINQPFTYPEEYFFSILLKGIQDSTIRAYKSDNDKFKYRLSGQDLQNIISKPDTISQIDPITYETKQRIVFNRIDPEDIKRYRVKEMWYFDKQQSVLKVRILGIAPLRDMKNEAGEFLFEQPLFWVYYPNCREYLGKHRAFIEGNDSNPMSWEDMMELRRFSSYVWKSSNVQNRRLEHYLQGVDILLEGEKIKQDIFNFEHDLWSY